MSPIPVKALALAACFTIAGAVQASAATYVTTLAGTNENPPNASPGSGTATLVIAGDVMNLSVNFQDLVGVVTAAHIHCCAAPPANVGVATPVPSFPGFPSGVSSGTYNANFDLNSVGFYNPTFFNNVGGGTVAGAKAAFLTGLNNGQAYLNIHTNVFPGGEIRGQWSLVPEPGTWALMITGFGLTGLVIRRRRTAPLAA